jgi:hypothetical protein
MVCVASNPMAVPSLSLRCPDPCVSPTELDPQPNGHTLTHIHLDPHSPIHQYPLRPIYPISRIMSSDIFGPTFLLPLRHTALTIQWRGTGTQQYELQRRDRILAKFWICGSGWILGMWVCMGLGGYQWVCVHWVVGQTQWVIHKDLGNARTVRGPPLGCLQHTPRVTPVRLDKV